jgi:hypothetical protein
VSSFLDSFRTLLLLCFRQTNPLFPKDYLKLQDTLSEDDPRKKSFGRHNFLRFGVSTVASEGSLKLFARQTQQKCPEFANRKDTPPVDAAKLFSFETEAEGWEDETWKGFPKFEEIDNVRAGPGLELLSWLVYTFGPRLAYYTRKESGKKRKVDRMLRGTSGAGLAYVLDDDEEDNGIGSLTVDDFAFIFVQAQHNIHKWNLVYRSFKSGYIEGWEQYDSVEKCDLPKSDLSGEDAKRVWLLNEWGYEYPKGAGVSGKEGQLRYAAITKFFHEKYYNRGDEEVEENRKILDKAVKELAAQMQEEATMEESRTCSSRGVARRRGETPRDSMLDSIQNSMWGDEDFGVLVHVPHHDGVVQL